MVKQELSAEFRSEHALNAAYHDAVIAARVRGLEHATEDGVRVGQPYEIGLTFKRQLDGRLSARRKMTSSMLLVSAQNAHREAAHPKNGVSGAAFIPHTEQKQERIETRGGKRVNGKAFDFAVFFGKHDRDPGWESAEETAIDSGIFLRLQKTLRFCAREMDARRRR